MHTEDLPEGEPTRDEGELRVGEDLSIAALLWFGVAMPLAFATPLLGLIPWVLQAPVQLMSLVAVMGFATFAAQRWLATRVAAVLAAGVAALWFGPLHLLPVLVTLALLAANYTRALRTVVRTGSPRAALPGGAIVCILFLLLFIQVSCHFGADHFHWETPPGPFRWLGFMLAHVFRALDVPDLLQTMGFAGLQPVEHAGLLTAAFLVVFHATTDVMALGAVSAFEPEEDLFRYVKTGLMYFLVVMLPLSALLDRTRPADLVLWPLDNVLRVVDFADAMQLFGIRLHGVYDGLWPAILGAAFRVFLVLALLDQLTRVSTAVRLRHLKGLGLSADDLEDVIEIHPDETVRQLARDRLAVIQAADEREAARPAEPWEWYGARGRVAMRVAVFGFALAAALAWSWPSLARGLGTRACRPDGWGVTAALDALGRMGPQAAGAAESMGRAAPGLPVWQGLAVVNTLGRLGPDAAGPLDTVARHAASPVSDLARKTRDQIDPKFSVRPLR